jgi:integrase
MGSVVRKVDRRGYVTFKPRVVLDGITYWGEGVGVGKGGERAAWLRADQNRKKLLRDLARNEYQDVEHRRATLSGVIDDWWTEILGSSREPATRRRKEELLAVLRPQVGSTLPARLVLLRPPHVRALHAALRADGRASSTVRGAHDLLMQVLRWASRQGMPVHAPLLNGAVERPGHAARETRSISVAEALRLFADMGHERPFGPLVKTMYYQGLRDSEASALKWGDIGTDGIDVKRKRGKRDRAEGAPKWASSGWVPMLPQTRESLEEHRRRCDTNGDPTGPDDLVFGYRSHARAPIRPPIQQTTWQHINDACARAELSRDIAAHSLRRAFSDAAPQADVSVADLAELLRRQARKISRVMWVAPSPREVTVEGTVSDLNVHEAGELNS